MDEGDAAAGGAGAAAGAEAEVSGVSDMISDLVPPMSCFI